MSVGPVPVALPHYGLDVPVYRAGSGRPLLYLHGLEGMRHGFVPALEGLAGAFDLVAPVLPGWDDTPGLDAIDDVHDMVLFLQDLADTLGLAYFDLAGHSIGAMFAAELAAARPDLVRRLVLAAPFGLWLDEAPVADFFAAPGSALTRLLYADPDAPAVRAFSAAPEGLDAVADATYHRLANFAADGKFLWPIPDRGLKKRLHRIGAETLLLWGGEDRVVPPAYGLEFQRRLARAQLTIVPAAGHMLPLENPTAFAGEATAFLG